MIEKPKVLKCTIKVLEKGSTFEMYLSTTTDHFPEMYLSTFQVLYKLYLSTDVLKYKVLLPGSAREKEDTNALRRRLDRVRDDIKEKGLSGEEVYARRYKLKMLRPVSAGPLYSYNISSLFHCLSNLLLKEFTGVGA